ncbi:MAG: acyl-CoA dehydrogenase family protein [bacterium]|nr:acyl-CoA dehydrogenase family protein [bacterium]
MDVANGGGYMFSLHLTAEQQAIRAIVRDFVHREIKPIALMRERLSNFDERFPWEVLEKASRMGLRTLLLSERFGGVGADSLTSCIVTEELAVGDVGIAATLGQTSALARSLFDDAMTDLQRSRFLSQFLSDDQYHLAIAGHEPDTDLGWSYYQPRVLGANYKTNAVRDANGDWVINGVKNFITNAPIAKLIAVEVRTRSTNDGTLGTSSFLVPGNTPGLTIREHDKVGRRLGSNGEMVFVDCRVPSENLLGEEGKSTLMNGGKLPGRGTPRFQAMNLGIGRAAYEAALQFAKLRVQGGKRIIAHQSVGMTLANMAIGLETARSLLWQAAWASDHPEAYADASLPDIPLQTIAKVVISETVQRVTLDAAQIFGGMGVMCELPMQKYVRDAMVFLHSEHTNDVARLRIAEDLAGYSRAGLGDGG